MPISFYVKSGEDFLHSTLWIPDKSRREAVVFCHGWGGGAQYDDLLERLAHEGYYALRLSQRGYGSSTGRADLSLWAKDMAACAASVRGAADKVWAAGQSTGATMTLVAAATEDAFAGGVAIAPFVTLAQILEDNPNARKILEERFGPLQEKHFRTADAAKIATGLKKPVLIVHGTAVETVPFAHGELLYRKLEGAATHRPVAGGNHHLTNVDRAAVIADIVEWLKQH